MSKRSVSVDGSILKDCRIAKAWSQEFLARQAGVDPKTVIKAEAGGRVDLDVLRRLAEAVGKDPKQLMQGADSMGVVVATAPEPSTLEGSRAAAEGNVSLAQGRSKSETEAGLVLLGFWHGQFGTYTVYLKDEFKVSDLPTEITQGWFKSQADEAWSELERTMNRLKLSVSRAAVEEDRTNPLIVMEDKQKRLYRAVERRFGPEEARAFLYGDLLGGELLWCENLTRGSKNPELVASVWSMKKNQLSTFGPILNLPEAEKLVEIVDRLSQVSGDMPILEDVQRARERIAGRCEEILFSDEQAASDQAIAGATQATHRSEVPLTSPLLRASFRGDANISVRLHRAIQRAYNFAVVQADEFLGIPHLLVGLSEIEDGEFARLLANHGVSRETVRSAAFQHIRKADTVKEDRQPQQIAVTDGWRDTLALAIDHSRRRLQDCADEDDVLAAVLETRPFLLESLGISIDELKKDLKVAIGTPYETGPGRPARLTAKRARRSHANP